MRTKRLISAYIDKASGHLGRPLEHDFFRAGFLIPPIYAQHRPSLPSLFFDFSPLSVILLQHVYFLVVLYIFSVVGFGGRRPWSGKESGVAMNLDFWGEINVQLDSNLRIHAVLEP